MGELRAIGERSFRRELNEHEERLITLEANPGGGGSGKITIKELDGHELEVDTVYVAEGLVLREPGEWNGKTYDAPVIVPDIFYTGKDFFGNDQIFGSTQEEEEPISHVVIGEGLVVNQREEGVVEIKRATNVIDRFSVEGPEEDGFLVLPGETVNFGELVFSNEGVEVPDVMFHIFLSVSAEGADIVVSEPNMGLGLYDDEGEKITDLALVSPSVKAGVITPVVMEFLLRNDKFYPGPSAKEGVITWRVRPFWTNPEEAEVQLKVFNDYPVVAEKSSSQPPMASFGIAYLL